jgi:hypothetical protein
VPSIPGRLQRAPGAATRAWASAGDVDSLLAELTRERAAYDQLAAWAAAWLAPGSMEPPPPPVLALPADGDLLETR